jgi:hypothetical protein
MENEILFAYIFRGEGSKGYAVIVDSFRETAIKRYIKEFSNTDDFCWSFNVQEIEISKSLFLKFGSYENIEISLAKYA